MRTGVVKEVPLANLFPPVCASNHSIVPSLGVAEMVTEPDSQTVAEVVAVISGKYILVLATIFKGASPGSPYSTI